MFQENRSSCTEKGQSPLPRFTDPEYALIEQSNALNTLIEKSEIAH